MDLNFFGAFPITRKYFIHNSLITDVVDEFILFQKTFFVSALVLIFFLLRTIS